MASTPFVVTPALAAIAVAYRQANLIADQVLPRVFVPTPTFRYLKYGIADALQMPDTTVGRKSAPNQIDWSSSELSASVVDQGLDAPVPSVDTQVWEQARQAGPGFVSQASPEARATSLVMQTVQNRREYRTASLVFNAANYGTNNKATLSGTSQWSDYANSDPLSVMLAAFDTMIMRPNNMVLGRQVATKLRSHPKICLAIFGNNTTNGIVPLRALADLLELDNIYVGDAWVNTAAPGQTPVTGRAWGKHCCAFHRNMEATPEGGLTMGFTAQWGPQIAGEIVDSDVGLRGGKRIRAGESVVELMTANDLGYLWTNAIA